MKLSTISPGTLSAPLRAGSNCQRFTAAMADPASASATASPFDTDSAPITLPVASMFARTLITISPAIDRLTLSCITGAV